MQQLEMQFMTNEIFLSFLKLAAVFILLLYIAFSVLVLRQTQLMTKTVTGSMDKAVHTLAWIYFMIVGLVFIFSIFYL